MMKQVAVLLIALSALVASVHATCGDGIVDVQSETCDDGNLNNGDGCDSNCQTEGDFGCDTNNPSTCCPSQIPTSPCSGNGFCADGTIPPPGPAIITLFPAVNLNGQISNAHAICQQNGLNLVPFDSLLIAGALFSPVSRDVWHGYFINPPGNWAGGAQYQFGHNTFGRTCWSTNNDFGPGSSMFYSNPNAVCTATDPQLFVACYAGAGSCSCSPTWQGGQCTESTGGSVCGNGFLQSGEACDDGNTTPGDGCSASCQIEAGWHCDAVSPRDCCPTTVPGEFCSNQGVCTNSTCVCSSGWTGPDCATPDINCGDGILELGEQCDDGNMNNGDGCSSTCMIESGYSCDTSVSPSLCSPVCGDGFLSGSEECDDGNRDDLDGCDGNCRLQPNWMCPTPGSPCQCSGDAGCNGGTCSAGVCSCPGGTGSPSCEVPCDAATTCSGHGTCSTTTYPDICQCDADWYGPDCSVQCDAGTTCGGNGVCSPTGRCVCNLGSSGQDCAGSCAGPTCTCTVCGRFTAGNVPPGTWGVTNFADIQLALATCGTNNIEVICPPLPIPGVDPVCNITGNGLTFGSPPDLDPVPLPCRGVLRGDSITIQGASFQPTSCSAPLLDLDVTTRLRISNLGSSGQDGVSIDYSREIDITPCSFSANGANTFPGTQVGLRADSFFDVFYRTTDPPTPNQHACMVEVFRQEFGPVQFGDRNSLGCSALRATVASPVTIENQNYANFPGSPPTVDVTMDGTLTFRNNSFSNIPRRALNVVGAREMDVDNNIFNRVGGQDVAASRIEGVLPATGAYKFTKNRNFNFYDLVNITESSSTAFWLHNMDTSGGTFNIADNEHICVDPPGPATWHCLHYGLRISSFPTGPECGESGVKADERCYAIDDPAVPGRNNLVMGLPRPDGAWIVRGMPGADPPTEANYCDDSCPTSPFLNETTQDTDDWRFGWTMAVTQAGSSATTFTITIDTFSNHINALPIVSLDAINDAITPRWQDSCASRPTTMIPPTSWNDTLTWDSGVGFNGWTATNTTGPAGEYHHQFTRIFELADVLQCHVYNNASDLVVSNPSSGVYSWDVCVGFYEGRNNSDEAAGFDVRHDSCTPVTLSQLAEGAVIVGFVTDVVNFEANVTKSRFLPNGHLEVTVETYFDHFGTGTGSTLRGANIAATTGNLGLPSTWTIANPSTTPCQGLGTYPLAATKCKQVWIVTSNTEDQRTMQSLFQGLYEFRWTLYDNNGVARNDQTDLYGFYASVRIQRTLEQAVDTLIAMEATVYRDEPWSIPYDKSAGEVFLSGETVFIKVNATLNAVNYNNYNLTIDQAIYCTPLYPDDVVAYNSSRPAETGCSTRGVGIGSNTGILYRTIGGNSGYPQAASINSDTYKQGDLHQAGLKFSSNPFLSDAKETYVQISVTLTDLLAPGGPSAVPVPVGPAHGRPRTRKYKFRLAYNAKGKSVVFKPLSAATMEDAQHQFLMSVEEPHHIGGVGFKVDCPNRSHKFVLVEDKEDGKKECIDLSTAQKYHSDGYYWYDPHHNNHSNGAWIFIVIVAVVVIIAVIIAIVWYTYERDDHKHKTVHKHYDYRPVPQQQQAYPMQQMPPAQTAVQQRGALPSDTFA